MYGVLLAASVPGPLVAGWLSDRIGRKPVIIGVYVAGACSIALFVLAGSDMPGCGSGSSLLSLFSFVESPQLQALLADVTPGPMRDAAFSTYFALAFGVGVDVGDHVRVVIASARDGARAAASTFVFWLMAAASVAAALATLRIRIPRRHGAATEHRRGHGGRPRLTSRPGDPGRGMRYHAPAPQRALTVGAWRSLVARIVRDDEVGGSNPLAPTRLTSSSSLGSDETRQTNPKPDLGLAWT